MAGQTLKCWSAESRAASTSGPGTPHRHRMINFASQERELLGTYVQVRVTGAGPNSLVGEHAV